MSALTVSRPTLKYLAHSTCKHAPADMLPTGYVASSHADNVYTHTHTQQAPLVCMHLAYPPTGAYIFCLICCTQLKENIYCMCDCACMWRRGWGYCVHVCHIILCMHANIALLRVRDETKEQRGTHVPDLARMCVSILIQYLSDVLGDHAVFIQLYHAGSQ